MSYVLTLISCLVAAAPPPDTSGSKPNPETLVKFDPLPPGYAAELKEVRDGDKLLGHRLFVTKEGAVSKVVIGIEDREIASRAARVAATKGYVNGTAQAMGSAGAKLLRKSIPDLDQADFKERFVVDLVYEKPGGGELLIQLQIFFGKAGYHIQIVGDNPDDFDALVKWARSVKGL